MNWYEEVVADAVARYDATPEWALPIVVVHTAWLARHRPTTDSVAGAVSSDDQPS